MLNVTCFPTSFILQRVRYAMLFIVCYQHQPIENCETKGFSIKRLTTLAIFFYRCFLLEISLLASLLTIFIPYGSEICITRYKNYNFLDCHCLKKTPVFN